MNVVYLLYIISQIPYLQQLSACCDWNVISVVLVLLPPWSFHFLMATETNLELRAKHFFLCNSAMMFRLVAFNVERKLYLMHAFPGRIAHAEDIRIT